MREHLLRGVAGRQAHPGGGGDARGLLDGGGDHGAGLGGAASAPKGRPVSRLTALAPALTRSLRQRAAAMSSVVVAGMPAPSKSGARSASAVGRTILAAAAVLDDAGRGGRAPM